MSALSIAITLAVVLLYLLLASRKALPNFDREREARRLVALYDQRQDDEPSQQDEREYRLYHELARLRSSDSRTRREQLPLALFGLIIAVLAASTLAWYSLGGKNALQWQRFNTMLDHALVSSQYLGMDTPDLPAQDLNTYCHLLQTRIERHDGIQLDALARCYLAYNNFPAAAEVYQAWHRLQPDNDAVAMDYAETRLMSARNRPMSAEIERLLQSLRNNPAYATRAQLMLAAGYLQSGERARALPLWQQLAAETPHNHPLYPVIEQTLASLQEDIGEANNADTPASEGLTLSLQIDIDSATLAQLPAQAALFISVIGTDSPIPILAQRLPAKATQSITLDARNSMNGARLSAEQTVIVRATLSADGSVGGETLANSEQRITLPHPAPIWLKL